MKRLALMSLFAAGCTRDPTFYGYWDIFEVERAGVTLLDPGFFEVGNGAELSLFLRYRWESGGFVPEAHPIVQIGTTSAVAQEVFGNYKSKGETYTFTMDLFQATFDVDRYVADEATLTVDAAVWPPGTELAETTLFIRR